jgi:hypothetical protein
MFLVASECYASKSRNMSFNRFDVAYCDWRIRFKAPESMIQTLPALVHVHTNTLLDGRIVMETDTGAVSLS